MWNKNAHSACEYEKMGRAPFFPVQEGSYAMACLGLKDLRRKLNAKPIVEEVICAITKSIGRNTNHGNNSITSMMVFPRKKSKSR